MCIRDRGQDTGQNHWERCRYRHNFTEHGWHNCPLRLSHEAEDAKEQANVVQESAACFTRVQVDSSELEDFAIVIGDDTQVKKDVPAAAQPEERAAGDVQVQTTPAAATREKLAATSLLQAEEAPDATEIVAYINVFQVEKVNPQVVTDTTVYIDSATSSHMVCTEPRISKQVIKLTDCDVRIIGSCGTSNATKKDTLRFGVRNAQHQIIPVALEVLLVRNPGANICSVGALAEKGVKYDLLSTPPALRHGSHTFPISTAIPRMYAKSIIIDDMNLGTVDIYRTKVDAHMWHRRMGHWNPQALHAAAGGQVPNAAQVCCAGNIKRRAVTRV